MNPSAEDPSLSSWVWRAAGAVNRSVTQPPANAEKRVAGGPLGGRFAAQVAPHPRPLRGRLDRLGHQPQRLAGAASNSTEYREALTRSDRAPADDGRQDDDQTEDRQQRQPIRRALHRWIGIGDTMPRREIP